MYSSTARESSNRAQAAIVASLALWAICTSAIAEVPDPADFVGGVDHLYYPLTPGTTYHYESTTDRIDEITVMPETKVVQGVPCVVVRDRAIEDGFLREESFNWFAQDKEGNVWIFGEDGKDLNEVGEVISTEGSWTAGEVGAVAGIVMPADAAVGQSFAIESAPGIAETSGTILETDTKVQVAFGSFSDCIKIKETNALQVGEVEWKYFAPGIGLILDEEVEGGDDRFELGTITKESVNPSDFHGPIDNPFFPLIPGTTNIYEGTTDDGEVTVEEHAVLHTTKRIQGVTCTVLRERTLTEGVIIEEGFKWYAQDTKGSVWFFGEETTEFDESGRVTGSEFWEAGVRNAWPGILMLAQPEPGELYFQEHSAGVALDMAMVEAIEPSAEVPLISMADVVQTRVFSPLDPGVSEYKYYARGLGFIHSTTFEGGTGQRVLVRIERDEAPALAVLQLESTQTALSLRGIPGLVYQLEASSDLVNWSSFKSITLNAVQVVVDTERPANTSPWFFRILRR